MNTTVNGVELELAQNWKVPLLLHWCKKCKEEVSLS